MASNIASDTIKGKRPILWGWKTRRKGYMLLQVQLQAGSPAGKTTTSIGIHIGQHTGKAAPRFQLASAFSRLGLGVLYFNSESIPLD
jgi:hypothetical protein